MSHESANHNDALKCLDKAKEFQFQNFEKAKFWAEKSLRLRYSDEAKSFLESLGKSSVNENNVPNDQSSVEDKRYRTKSQPSDANRKAQSDPPVYTPEQINLINKVLNNRNDYYKVLDVKKDDKNFEAMVKKKYKKMALLMHPDKCKHPKADEAFKVLSVATQTLTDPIKKEEYDILKINGNTGLNYRGPRRQQNHPGFHTPEDLFNAFFGGGFHTEYVYREAPRRNPRPNVHPSQQAGTNFLPSVQIFFFVLLLLFSLLSHFLTEPSIPNFRFQPDSKFSVSHISQPSSINFYLTPTTATEFNGRQHELDPYVEIEYFKNECERERAIYMNSSRQKQRELQRGGKFFENCHKLKNIENKYRRRNNNFAFF
eukprot:GHVP01067953.1.p1 GENE.GHVP01067953.1~~GHVP01067953.1.p1  ORF type:complete len:378 (+),score=46.51 GHVP01067953.1:23-1135(+)